MKQLSISQIQRDLHKLDAFDIVEIIDKKRNIVKGYYIQSRYRPFVEEIAERIESSKRKEIPNLAGSLHRYADPVKREQEEGAWQREVVRRYREER